MRTTTITPATTPATTTQTGFVYAYGKVRARFASLSDEHEFFHEAVDDPENPRDKSYLDVKDEGQLEALYLRGDFDALLYTVLSRPENRYLARAMIWVLEDVAGVARLVVEPGGDQDLLALVASLAPGGSDDGGTIVVAANLGQRSRYRDLPRVRALQLCAMKITALVQEVRSKSVGADLRDADIKELFTSYVALTCNTGSSPEQRAVSYMLLNSPELYARAAQLQPAAGDGKQQAFDLVAVTGVARDLEAERPLIDVVFGFQGRDSGVVRRWVASVDVNGPLPFAQGTLRPYIHG